MFSIIRRTRAMGILPILMLVHLPIYGGNNVYLDGLNEAKVLLHRFSEVYDLSCEIDRMHFKAAELTCEIDRMYEGAVELTSTYSLYKKSNIAQEAESIDLKNKLIDIDKTIQTIAILSGFNVDQCHQVHHLDQEELKVNSEAIKNSIPKGQKLIELKQHLKDRLHNINERINIISTLTRQQKNQVDHILNQPRNISATCGVRNRKKNKPANRKYKQEKDELVLDLTLADLIQNASWLDKLSCLAYGCTLIIIPILGTMMIILPHLLPST